MCSILIFIIGNYYIKKKYFPSLNYKPKSVVNAFHDLLKEPNSKNTKEVVNVKKERIISESSISSNLSMMNVESKQPKKANFNVFSHLNKVARKLVLYPPKRISQNPPRPTTSQL